VLNGRTTISKQMGQLICSLSTSYAIILLFDSLTWLVIILCFCWGDDWNLRFPFFMACWFAISLNSSFKMVFFFSSIYVFLLLTGCLTEARFCFAILAVSNN
jgi:hypothetical protein